MSPDFPPPRVAAAVADSVLEAMLSYYQLVRPSEVDERLRDELSSRDFHLSDPYELADAAAMLRSLTGRIKFRVDLGSSGSSGIHPMVLALRRADGVLQLGHEIEHPLERDQRDRHRPFSSVVAVRSVDSAGVALSTERLPLHHDGLGTAGSVRFVAMCLDQGPASGGEQSYVNVLAHGIRLANRHWRRFVDATRVDALTIHRISGSGQIRVTGPMFYVDELGIPAVHFRVPGGEYTVRPSRRVTPWFSTFLREVEQSATVELITPSDCVVVDNLCVAHARAAFTESRSSPRRLSRKWYGINAARSRLKNQASLRLSPAVYGLPAQLSS